MLYAPNKSSMNLAPGFGVVYGQAWTGVRADAALNPAEVKRIAPDGAGGFILPDGTTVPGDQAGGFTLPNGAHVAPDGRGGLLLPNGARCVSDGLGGYACP